MKEDTKRRLIYWGIVAFIFVLIISWVIWAVHKTKEPITFCEDKGYDSFHSMEVKDDTKYIRCCDLIIKESDFEEECKIFKKEKKQ